MTTILIPQTKHVSVALEGDRVLVIQDGRAILDLPWNAAQMIARALLIKANEAEALANAEQAIFDQALLYRTGAPFAFSTDKRITDSAVKEAGWNDKLRRYIRRPRFDRGISASISSGEKFGKPEVKG